jgi:ABC-type transport system substrate-binding protein/class 3 adenylate cyclase
LGVRLVTVTSLEGERRIVSVLVTDVVDSTSIGETLGAERSKFLFDEVSRIVEAAVARFGGTVAQHTGDGVLAVFGAPVAHEDDAERAVRSALAFQQDLDRLGRELTEAYGVQMAARAAVNTGVAAVPRGEAPADALYNALGDTVNVAARLQSHAHPGGVIVGPRTAQLLDGVFSFEEAGQLELKGKSESVAAFHVVGEVQPPTLVWETALVGRERESEVLERVFADLLDGRGAIVCITGEPGIGKSRMVAEARARYGGDVRFLEGGAVEYAKDIPYWPVRGLLRDWLELPLDAPEARVRLELRAALARLLGVGADDAYPFLAKVLGVPPADNDTGVLGDLSRDSVRRQTHEAIRALVSALAEELPLCLVLDDLHWADEATLELAEELLATSEDEAAVLLLLYRSERSLASWRLGEIARQRYPHRHEELELRTLDDVNSRLLAASTAGAHLPEEVASLLSERAGGNPYFIEQALHGLVEGGALRRENGGYALVDASRLTVPVVVQEALQARLDRLSPEAREVVGAAAVAGRTFTAPLLERLVSGVAIAPVLSDLQRLDLVVESRRRPVREYRFRHGLLREAAYDSLLEARRRELHRAVGLALEDLSADAPGEVAGLLSHHFAEADDPEKAAAYSIAAGDAARALYANQEALSAFRRAIPFLDRIGDEQRARDTLLRIGLSHHLAFEFEAAGEAYREAFQRQPPTGMTRPSERLETALGQPDGVVPGHASLAEGWLFAGHLFRGLLKMDAALNIVPDVAESFELAADGCQYRFRLRADAYWSDGERVTAHDFAETWRRMQIDGVQTAYHLADMTRAVALDARTLEIGLAAPRSYFLYQLASPPFFPWPSHIVDRFGADWYRQPGLVGNGPYTLAEHDDTHAVLRASPARHGSAGNVAEVHISFLPYENRAPAWRSGSFDLIQCHLLERDEEIPHSRVAVTHGLTTGFMVFCAASSALDDVRVRRALAVAIDRSTLVASFASEWTAALGGILPPSMPAHTHRLAIGDGRTPEQLLTEAGFPAAREFPELTVVGPDGAGPVGEALSEQWGRVGVSMTYHGFDTTPGPADVLIWGWNADYPDPDGMLRMFLEDVSEVRRTDEIADLLDRARSLTNPDERWRLYREAERQLVAEQVAVVPVDYWTPRIFYRPWVERLHLNAIYQTPFDDLIVNRRAAPT